MHEDDADAQDDVTYEEREIINRAGNVKRVRVAVGLQEVEQRPPPPNPALVAQTANAAPQAPVEDTDDLNEHCAEDFGPPRAVKVSQMVRPMHKAEGSFSAQGKILLHVAICSTSQAATRCDVEPGSIVGRTAQMLQVQTKSGNMAMQRLCIGRATLPGLHSHGSPIGSIS